MRPIRRPTPAVIAGLVIAALLFARWTNLTPSTGRGQSRSRQVLVAYVVDGDTFRTSDGERVRLLGVDAPEIAHENRPGESYGVESARWLKDKIENRYVKLVSGPSPQDKYGRTLAWVYLGGSELVNRELLRHGQARLLDRFGLPRELEESLREAEAAARVGRIGLWQR